MPWVKFSEAEPTYRLSGTNQGTSSTLNTKGGRYYREVTNGNNSLEPSTRNPSTQDAEAGGLLSSKRAKLDRE